MGAAAELQGGLILARMRRGRKRKADRQGWLGSLADAWAGSGDGSTLNRKNAHLIGPLSGGS
jgi:hypothetical protein